MHRRSAGLHGLFHAGDKGQRLVFHLDGAHGVPSLLLALGGHGGDFFAFIAGILRALPTSIFLTMAFGCGQRRMAAYSIFGRLTSAGKTAIPLTRP
jgi:hypothetical protein